MNGILLVTHGNVGQALMQCIAHVYGECPGCVETCSVLGGDEASRTTIRTVLAQMKNTYDSILILTDIYGASPSNMATQFVEPGRVAVLSGVNMPMLLRALSYRHEPLDTLCQRALEGGVRGMICTTTLSEKGL